MPKYMFQVSYTSAGAAGVLRDGGSKRCAAVEALVESVGGTLEAMYFTFGGSDAVAIAELPDAAAAMGVSLVASASGAARSDVIVLLTPEEVDAAAEKRLVYTPPGQ